MNKKNKTLIYICLTIIVIGYIMAFNVTGDSEKETNLFKGIGKTLIFAPIFFIIAIVRKVKTQ